MGGLHGGGDWSEDAGWTVFNATPLFVLMMDGKGQFWRFDMATNQAWKTKFPEEDKIESSGSTGKV